MTYETQIEKQSRIKSAILTIVFTSLVFLFLYFYKLYSTPVFPPYQEIAIDFVEEQLTLEETSRIPTEKEVKSSSASTPEEPAPAKILPKVEEKIMEKKVEPKEIKPKPILTEEKKENLPAVKKTETKKDEKRENDIKKTVEKSEKKTTEKIKENTTKSESKLTEKTSPSDGKGKSLADLLVKGKGKGTSTTSSNESNGTGNGGNSSSNSSGKGEFIGSGTGGRKLVSFIPGTLNRSNEAHPSHSCGNETGIVVIKYTVNKDGKVINAQLQSGNASPCIVNTSIDWVKKYVKAAPGKSEVSSTYRIEF
jgi:outer membrane biosynthesis protein TonB